MLDLGDGVGFHPGLALSLSRFPEMIGTNLASSSRNLWRLLERRDIDAATIFSESGLDPALMRQPRAHIPSERVSKAWERATELLDDPHLGLQAAEHWYPTDVHALGCAFLASSTLRSALERLARYVAVVDRAIAFEVRDNGDVTGAFHVDPMSTCEEDNMLAVFARLCRFACSDRLEFREVRFKHLAPEDSGPYRAAFGCPLRFGTDESAIVFSRDDVDRPLPASNLELAAVNDRILAGFLNDLQSDDLVGRVRRAIAMQLPSGAPSDELIANSVFMSTRNLRRKLAALGTSYSRLLTGVRRELANQYVSDSTFSLSEISYLLGFSEPSSFSRAYKRWTGVTPSVARAASAAPDA